MACSITIDVNTAKLIQDVAGDPPSSIQVDGSAEDCSTVMVYLMGINPTQEITVPVINGYWKAIFNTPDNFNPEDFPCGIEDIKIIATCKDDPDCHEDDTVAILNCVPRDCPDQVTLVVHPSNDSNSQVDLSECLPPGTYTIEVIDPVVTNAYYQWSLNGQTQSASSGYGQSQFNVSLEADVEQQSISVVVMLSPECLLSAAVTLNVCIEQTGKCADGVIFTVSKNGTPVVGPTTCLPAGEYLISVISPSGSGVSYSWSVDNNYIQGATGPDFSFTLAEGETHTIQVSAIQEDCPVIPGSVTLIGCENEPEPECVNQITWQVFDDQHQPVNLAADCLLPGKYTFVVTSPVGPGVTYIWNFNGQPQPGENSRNYSIELEHDQNAEVSVRAQEPNCPEIRLGLSVTGCGRPVDHDCPSQINLTVIDNNGDVVDPEDCLDTGEYSVLVVEPAGSDLSFTWSVDSEIQPGANTNTLTHSVGQDENVEIAVTVMKEDCDPLPGGVTLRNCTPQPPDVELPPAPSWCPYLFYTGLFMFLLGLILIWAGMCSLNIPLVTTGVVLAGVGTILLIAWALLCGTKQGGCRIFARLLQILMWMTIVLGIISAGFGVIVAICTEVTSPGVILALICSIPGACGVGAFIDFILSGFLLSVLGLIFLAVCFDWD